MALIENNLFGERDKTKIAIEMLKTFEPKEVITLHTAAERIQP